MTAALSFSWTSVVMPHLTSWARAASTTSGGFTPAGHLAAQIPQVVQEARLGRTSSEGGLPSSRLLMISIRPRVLADSQPTTLKTGQTERQVPHCTHL